MISNGRTDKLNGRTVYQRTLWLIGEQKNFRHSAPLKIVLSYYIRFWYSTPLLPDENCSKKPGLLVNNELIHTYHIISMLQSSTLQGYIFPVLVFNHSKGFKKLLLWHRCVVKWKAQHIIVFKTASIVFVYSEKRMQI